MSVDVAVAHPTDVLKALAEPFRWRVVELLVGEELCVCHIAEELGVAQPLVSHHLRALRDAGIVESERFRQWTYYRLRPGVLAGVAAHLTSIADTCPTPGDRRRPCC